MPVSAYRGYRGPRRKFRPQQPRLLSLSLSLASSRRIFLSLTLPFHSILLYPPSVLLSLFFYEVRRTPVALVFHVQEEILSFHPAVRAMKGAYTRDEHEDSHISRSYTLAAYQTWTLTTGVRSRCPHRESTTEHSWWPSRTAVLNHPSRG